MLLEAQKPYQLPHGISQALCVIVLSAMSAQRIFWQLVSTCYLSKWDKLWPKDRPHPGNHDTSAVTHPPGDDTPLGPGDNFHLASRTRGQSQQTGEWVLQHLICWRYVLESWEASEVLKKAHVQHLQSVHFILSVQWKPPELYGHPYITGSFVTKSSYIYFKNNSLSTVTG